MMNKLFFTCSLDMSERLHVRNFAVLKVCAKVRAVWAVSPSQPGSREITPRESIESRAFPRLPGILPRKRKQRGLITKASPAFVCFL